MAWKMDAALTLSFFFGLIGTGMFVYGRKASRLIPLGCGLGLMAVPCFIPNLVVLSIVCVALTAAPFLVREG